MLKTNKDHTHISVQKAIKHDGYMAMQARLAALIESRFLEKKWNAMQTVGVWTLRTEKVFQKLKGNCIGYLFSA